MRTVHAAGWKVTRVTTIGLLLIGAVSALGQDSQEPSETINYKAASPAEAVQFMEKAYKTGNLKAFVAALAPEAAEAAQKVLDACDEIKSLSDLLKEKFGKPLPKVENFDQKRRMMLTQSLTLTETPKFAGQEKVNLNVRKVFLGSQDGKKRTRDQIYIAIKDEGNWKLIPPEYDEKGIKKMESFAHMKEVAAKLKEGVEKGKIETHGEAVLRFLEALEKYEGKPSE